MWGDLVCVFVGGLAENGGWVIDGGWAAKDIFVTVGIGMCQDAIFSARGGSIRGADVVRVSRYESFLGCDWDSVKLIFFRKTVIKLNNFVLFTYFVFYLPTVTGC